MVRDYKRKFETNIGVGSSTVGFLGGVGYNKVIVRKNITPIEKGMILDILKNKNSLQETEKIVSYLSTLKEFAEKKTGYSIELRGDSE